MRTQPAGGGRRPAHPHEPDDRASLRALSRRRAIDWSGLFAEAESMSGGEQLLVSVASDLATREGTVALWELSERLARPTFDRVLEALELARGDQVTRHLEPVLNAA